MAQTGNELRSKANGNQGQDVSSPAVPVAPDNEVTEANAGRVATAKVSPAVSPPTQAVLDLFPGDDYELFKHDRMRKAIAGRLVEAKRTVPHFYLSIDCELDALLTLRAELNARAPHKDGQPTDRLTVNDMIIKALALALRDVPDANVTWTDEVMVKHRHSDVAVAVAIPGGLVTPIVRRSESKSLADISQEVKNLSERAKGRRLKPEEYEGGTTAVSNLGMKGISSFAAVINPPHATILAVGAGEQRAVVKKCAISIATVMTVTLSADHRCVDGAVAADLLGAFKRYIENPGILQPT